MASNTTSRKLSHFINRIDSAPKANDQFTQATLKHIAKAKAILTKYLLSKELLIPKPYKKNGKIKFFSSYISAKKLIVYNF